MSRVDVAKSSWVMIATLLVQHTLLDQIRFAGAHPDVTVLLPVAAGYVAGPDRGAGFGFASGLIADLFLPTTYGLSALVFCLAGYLTGLLTGSLVKTSVVVSSLLLTGAATATVVAYATVGALIGTSAMLTVYLVPALVATLPAVLILAYPMSRAVSWAVPFRGAAEALPVR